MNDTIKSIREQHNLTRKEFTELFKIPYRTLQDWELGNRKCPDYVIQLIKFKLEHLKE